MINMNDLLSQKEAAEFLNVPFYVFRQNYSAALKNAKVKLRQGDQRFFYFDREKLEEAKHIMSKFNTHRDRVKALENYFGE